MRILSLLLFTALLCSAGVVDPDKKVDALFSAAAGKRPGAAVAVVLDGRVVLMKGYGLADIGRAKPVTPSTIFRIASITKSLTATAVLQLVDAGKLKLDDPVSHYLPEIPAGIRVSHLLTHTAGIPDFIPYAEMLRRPLEFEPGSRLNYSNNGYEILGRLIGKVTGKSWDAVAREQIFAPLGMNGTGYDLGAAMPARATGYLLGKNGYEPISVPDARDASAAGGLFSTVEDLVRFEEAFAAGKLLRPETARRAWTPVALPGGRSGAYGYGWTLLTHRGVREVSHGGDITGFNSYLAIYPDEKLAVVVLSNVGMRPPGPVPTAGDLAHRIAEIWLGDRMQKEDAPSTVRVPAGILDGYTGRYRVEAPEEMLRNFGTELVVTREGDRLFAEANGMKAPLDAKSETVFQAPGSPVQLTFVRAADRKCPEIVITLMGLREFRAVRAD